MIFDDRVKQIVEDKMDMFKPTSGEEAKKIIAEFPNKFFNELKEYVDGGIEKFGDGELNAEIVREIIWEYMRDHEMDIADMMFVMLNREGYKIKD